MDKDGEPSLVAAKRTGVYLFPRDSVRFGWSQFMSQMDLVKDYVRDGQITFVCSIMVLHDSGIPVPPSDIGKNLGMLLDSMDGLDVSFFTVDGETFHAHRAVLAARSPVFRAELLGSMAEVTMSSITLLDIAPATFRIVLRFMYMDAFPVQDELGDSHSEVLQHLLAAADRYALNPQKLWENMSVDTVADALACAEMYSCLELKKKCIGFIVAEKIFNKVVLTEGFMQLRQNFPFIITESWNKLLPSDYKKATQAKDIFRQTRPKAVEIMLY
ncbi:BTB/POZ and MATH domain-containing protein 1-like [Setaria italica]|uniref:BTB/POZ and MATH domain-containing protein 1-like n=1 Tax=Setaria italica TaxID=4555 RepID=UPI000BE611BC|nr:BTB/POZ and MATH domain-containing protein 1-like [Setaria italica]